MFQPLEMVSTHAFTSSSNWIMKPAIFGYKQFKKRNCFKKTPPRSSGSLHRFQRTTAFHQQIPSRNSQNPKTAGDETSCKWSEQKTYKWLKLHV